LSKTAKQKGRLGQQEIRDALLEAFPELEPDDIKSTVMGDTGADIQLSPAARKLIPISIEVKRRKSGLKTVYGWMQQANNHTKNPPVVFYRGDRQKWLVVTELDHYIQLLRGNNDKQ
jgi:hypothetical protein|tara:strand:+ start:120 stop:470 length:351 start_codon:yes stop_codon:yes gene_type:complete